MNILIATANNKSRNGAASLARALSKNHKVTICSMSSDHEYRGQAFSYVNKPIRVNKITSPKKPLTKGDNDCGMENIAIFEFYSNPANAMSIMLGEIMRNRLPDIVICGVSNGTNMGPDVYSSSYVGMAMEAGYFGRKAIVISTEFEMGDLSDTSLKPVMQFTENNIEKFAKAELPPHTFLNINIPKVDSYKKYKGVKFTEMGIMNSRLVFDEGVDPKGEKYYWSKVAKRENIGDELDDKTWYDKGYISVTPISYDATDFEAIEGWDTLVKGISKRGAQ